MSDSQTAKIYVTTWSEELTWYIRERERRELDTRRDGAIGSLFISNLKP